MKRLFRNSTAALALAACSIAVAQQGPVEIVGLVELSGTGATAGTNFDNGVKLAVKEINAAGAPRPQDRIHIDGYAVAALRCQVTTTLPPASAK